MLLLVLATIVMRLGKKSDQRGSTYLKEGQQSLNRDEGSYKLSHTYDRFLATSHHYRGKNRKKNYHTSSDEGL